MPHDALTHIKLSFPLMRTEKKKKLMCERHVFEATRRKADNARPNEAHLQLALFLQSKWWRLAAFALFGRGFDPFRQHFCFRQTLPGPPRDIGRPAFCCMQRTLHTRSLWTCCWDFKLMLHDHRGATCAGGCDCHRRPDAFLLGTGGRSRWRRFRDCLQNQG